jgi:hypothetical protein
MDKVTLVKSEIRAAEWSEQIHACKNSGIPVLQWCRENGINLKTYYYHLRKLREKVCEQIPVAVSSQQEKTGASVIVRDTSGVFAEIADGTSAATIEAVIRALKC